MSQYTYYYPRRTSTDLVEEPGELCDGHNSEPCECCGLRCGHLDSIHKKGLILMHHVSPDAIAEEYGHSSVDYCTGCKNKEIERLKARIKELEEA